jgi:hypothetical protein
VNVFDVFTTKAPYDSSQGSKSVQAGQGLKVRKSGNDILLISTVGDVGDALGLVVGVRSNVKSVVVDEEAGMVNTGKWVVK